MEFLQNLDEKFYTWLDTPSRYGKFGKQYCCVDCCNPAHSYDHIKFGKPLPQPYVKPIIPLVGHFEKFDYKKYYSTLD